MEHSGSGMNPVQQLRCLAKPLLMQPIIDRSAKSRLSELKTIGRALLLLPLLLCATSPLDAQMRSFDRHVPGAEGGIRPFSRRAPPARQHDAAGSHAERGGRRGIAAELQSAGGARGDHRRRRAGDPAGRGVRRHPQRLAERQHVEDRRPYRNHRPAKNAGYRPDRGRGCRRHPRLRPGRDQDGRGGGRPEGALRRRGRSGRQRRHRRRPVRPDPGLFPREGSGEPEEPVHQADDRDRSACRRCSRSAHRNAVAEHDLQSEERRPGPGADPPDFRRGPVRLGRAVVLDQPARRSAPRYRCPIRRASARPAPRRTWIWQAPAAATAAPSSRNRPFATPPWRRCFRPIGT